MIKPQRKYIKEKYLLLDAVAESILEQEEKEFIEESKELGFDVKLEAASVREMINSSIKRAKTQKLNDAEKEYKTQVEFLRTKKPSVSYTIQEKRAMLAQIASKRPELVSRLTIQHRSFDEITDTDLDEIFNELDQLGFFDSKNGE